MQQTTPRKNLQPEAKRLPLPWCGMHQCPRLPSRSGFSVHHKSLDSGSMRLNAGNIEPLSWTSQNTDTQLALQGTWICQDALA